MVIFYEDMQYLVEDYFDKITKTKSLPLRKKFALQLYLTHKKSQILTEECHLQDKSQEDFLHK